MRCGELNFRFRIFDFRADGNASTLCARIENRKSKIENAFTLIEAAVAILVVAILAGSMAPLALKAINQQREFRTREGLKAAFEGMFGARDRRVANMRADFGWNPSSTLSDLSGMVSVTGTGISPLTRTYAQDSNTLWWGWNGPYWTGSVDGSNRPLDGWGRPFQLRWISSGWQVFSLGANGTDDTGASTSPLGDDLAYPTVPAQPTAFKSVLYINLTNPSGRTGTITVNDRDGDDTLRSVTVYENGASTSSITSATAHSFIANPVSGGVKVTLTRSAGSPLTLYFVLDLLPGEVKQVDMEI